MTVLCPALKSQDLFSDAAGERIQACTDRSMYIAGETVYFSIFVYHETDLVDGGFSRVFYCELITPEGNRIAGQKYLLERSSGYGSLTIPEEVISGNYFLKYYTRFMRNFSTDKYKYIRLKIINPYKTEVISGKDAPGQVVPAGHTDTSHADDQSLKIFTDKLNFLPREEIRFRIGRDTAKEKPAGFCLSVVPEFTSLDPSFKGLEGPDAEKNGIYIPETRGVSLSGQLIGKGTGKPVADAKVSLSIIGDMDIMVMRTDSAGRFFFALPDYHGTRDIFLCAQDLPDIFPEILIDNDFCSKAVILPAFRFTLDSAEMSVAMKLAVNARITSVFRRDSIPGGSRGDRNISTPFYGTPPEILVMEKYIELPSLEDYFNELPLMVKLKRVEGRKQFRFYNELNDISMYAPLMLVDWVAVDDIEKILAMSPADIRQIELVGSAYIKGDITYGGIISFVSKKTDFAGIDLPASGTFVNYRFLGESSANAMLPDLPANIPDSRNTVYWDPSVQTDAGGTAVITFPAPDTPGKYCIMLREITRTGEVLSNKAMIEVIDR